MGFCSRIAAAVVAATLSGIAPGLAQPLDRPPPPFLPPPFFLGPPPALEAEAEPPEYVRPGYGRPDHDRPEYGRPLPPPGIYGRAPPQRRYGPYWSRSDEDQDVLTAEPRDPRALRDARGYPDPRGYSYPPDQRVYTDPRGYNDPRNREIETDAAVDPRGMPTDSDVAVAPPRDLSPDQSATAPDSDPKTIPAQFHRQIVSYPSREPAGTIVIDTPNTYLYYVLGGGRAIRYGIGVGREGFAWAGVETIKRKQEWPDWHPPEEMIERQPYLPRFMAGGPGNPLGARAMYLGNTLYRIHGTSEASSIGKRVSSGCIRLINDDVMDLYDRTTLGTRVVVLPDSRYQMPAGNAAIETRPLPQPPKRKVSQTSPRPTPTPAPAGTTARPPAADIAE